MHKRSYKVRREINGNKLSQVTEFIFHSKGMVLPEWTVNKKI